MNSIKAYNSKLKNNTSLFILSAVLFLPSLLDFCSVVFSNKMMTRLCYGIYVTLIFPFFCRNITKNHTLILLGIYVIVGLNYLLFPESRGYIESKEFLLNVLFFIPISVIIILNIKDWNYFFDVFFPFCFLSVFMNLYIVFFSSTDIYQADEAFNYMELSYAVLPAVCGSYVYFRQSHRIWTILVFVAGFTGILVYGARAVVLFSCMFIIVYELFASKLRKGSKLILVGFFAVIYANIEELLYSLSKVNIFSNSRFLIKFLDDDLFGHSTRTVIYNSCKQRIDTMGLDFSGLFGDRPYCGDVYPHNFIYEIIMSYGWLLGVIVLSLFTYLVVTSFINSKYKQINIFFLLSIFGRYFISGSYIIEGRFWIMLFALLSILYSSRVSTVNNINIPANKNSRI